MANLIKDVSDVTTVPEKTLKIIANKALICIADNVHEAILNKDEIASMDIGIGVLHIKVNEDNVRYKFIPNKALEKLVNDVIVNNESPLIKALEKSLTDKITLAYKELL